MLVKNETNFKPACYLCDSNRIHYSFVRNGKAVYQCEDCGFVFLNPQPADEMLQRRHDESRFYDVPIFLKSLLDYSGQEKGRLLEIGSSNGSLITAAMEAGFEVQSIDISGYANLPSGQFDVCALFDVIGHVRDPIELLLKVHSALKPDGRLLIATPSFDIGPESSVTGNGGGVPVDYLHYFDSQTIQNALAKTWFRDVGISRNKQFMVVMSRKSPAKSKPALSVILPVYNEKETFPELMETLLAKELPGLDREVIVVESNSTDGTREEVLRYKDTAGVRLVFEDRPQGKGHAVRSGLQYAAGDFIMIQDGDLEYDLNDYDELLEPLVKYQKAFVLGSRHSKGWKMRHFTDQPQMSLIMNFGQIFFTYLLNLFCGSKLKDPFTMYKIFRRDCLYGLTFKANRFDFDWEIVIKLLRKGYRPLEIPVNYNSRSFKQGKKVSLIKDPLLWIWALFRFRFGTLYEDRKGEK